MAFRKTKAPPGRPKLSGRKKPIDRLQQHKRWLHQALKSLQKELKKAKNFETQKIKRRIKQAQDASSAEGTTTGAKAAHQLDVDKLQAQIQAVKAVNPIALANKVAASAGLLDSAQVDESSQGPSQQDTDKSSQELSRSVLEVVQQRIARAACVRKQLEALTTEHSKLFTQKEDQTDAQQKQEEQVQGSDDEPAGDLQDADAGHNHQLHHEQSQHSQPYNDTAEHQQPKRQETGFQHPLLAHEDSDSEFEQDNSKYDSDNSQHLDDRTDDAIQNAAESDDDNNDEGMINAVVQRLATAKQRGKQSSRSDGSQTGRGIEADNVNGCVRSDHIQGSMDSQDDHESQQENDDDSGVVDEEFEDMSEQEQLHDRGDDDEAGGVDEGMDIDDQEAHGDSDGSFDSEEFDDFNSEDFDRDVNGIAANPGLELRKPREADAVDGKQHQRQQQQSSKPSTATAKPHQAVSDRGQQKAQNRPDLQGKAGKAKKSMSAREWIEKRNSAQDPVTGKPKNRLGQKARRALYEKMYGRNAMHLKQPVRQPLSKTAGRQSKEGHGGYADNKGRHTGKQSRMGTSLQEVKANTKVQKPATDESELHPSWAARKAAKQKMVISPAGSPAAKKIKFDDDAGVNQGSNQPPVTSSGHTQGDRHMMKTATHAEIANRGSHKGNVRPSNTGNGFNNSRSRDSKRAHPANSSKSHSSCADQQLHPSWLAKQAMKQQQNTLVPATGKKIVFDD